MRYPNYVLIDFVGGVLLSAATMVLASAVKYDLSILELSAVFTSYWCTLLCVHQSRWNYPIGIISTILYCVLFYQCGLYASMILNVYLPFALIWGWFRWGSDRATRPVTRVKWQEWLLIYLPLVGVSYVTVALCLMGFHATLPLMDTWILILTILAQWLLDNKKLETWGVWAIVNILAIVEYNELGLALVVGQYIFFLANTVYGAYAWIRTTKKA